MTRNVITVSRGDTLKFASDLLHANRIHQLPVVEGGELIGFVSGTDIRNSTFEETTVSETGKIVVKNKTVEEIMTREVITVSPWDTVEDALLIFHKRRLGALPVSETVVSSYVELRMSVPDTKPISSPPSATGN